MPKRTVTIVGTQKSIFEQIEEKSLQNSFSKILQFAPIIALSLDSALKEMVGSSSKKKKQICFLRGLTEEAIIRQTQVSIANT